MSMPSIQTSALAAVIAQRAQQARRPAAAPASSNTSVVPAAPTAPAAVLAANPMSTAQILRPGVESLHECVQFVEKAVRTERRSIVEIAYYGYRLSVANAWTELGYESEEHFVEHLGYSDRRWQQYMILGERLQPFRVDQLHDLTIESATQISRVHPRIWADYAWVEEAKLLTTAEFRALVEKRNREASPHGLTEPRAAIALSVPVSRRANLEKQIDALRKQRRLHNAAAAVEYALAAVERESALAPQIEALENEITELNRLWEGIAIARESEEERTSRYEGDPKGEALSVLGLKSQKLIRRIVKNLEKVRAIRNQGEIGDADKPKRAEKCAAATEAAVAPEAGSDQDLSRRS